VCSPNPEAPGKKPGGRPKGLTLRELSREFPTYPNE
jgi:hypothetical protein